VTDWGDVPTWISAVVTLLALAFAAVAAVAARRTYMIESERDRINAQARQAQDAYLRRAQAALMSAWWSDADSGAYVRNASDSPAYQAFLTVYNDTSHSVAKLDLPVVPPSDHAIMHQVELGQIVIGYRVSLTFTDSSGVRWERDRYGHLIELDPRVVIRTSSEVASVLSALPPTFLAHTASPFILTTVT
jgi:arabinogalactan oligomer / maltooligosaccharide transport system substrate-binding protein